MSTYLYVPGVLRLAGLAFRLAGARPTVVTKRNQETLRVGIVLRIRGNCTRPFFPPRNRCRTGSRRRAAGTDSKGRCSLGHACSRRQCTPAFSWTCSLWSIITQGPQNCNGKSDDIFIIIDKKIESDCLSQHTSLSWAVKDLKTLSKNWECVCCDVSHKD